MTSAQRALSALAHPQIAYLLLMLGTLGLTVELWSPGAVLPGVVGGICLLLAFFAFQVLPVSATGVLLILFGVVLLLLEVKVTSYGVLAVGGLVGLLLGSMMLVDSPLPELQVGLAAGRSHFAGGGRHHLLPRAAGGPGTARRVGHRATPACWRRPAARCRPFAPASVGRVQTHGEIWSATSPVPIHAGDMVRVVAVKGLLLTVVPESPTSEAALPRP